MAITLREISDDDRPAVVALRVAPDQQRFVSSVADSLVEAERHPEGNPWFRAVYDDAEPVGFVMLSWDLDPPPPGMNGPWFLWKLLVDAGHQGRGVGREVVRLVLEIVRTHGGTELLTSHVPGEDGPAGFYARLGFVPTGELDPDGEILLRRDVTDLSR